MNIEKNIRQFVNGEGKNQGRKPTERYSSFDYCFNYFQSFRDKNRVSDLAKSTQIQESCLQLGFYLASWGMLRGSSFLLEKSVKYYENLIFGISSFDNRIWTIDIDCYTDKNISMLLDCKEMIADSLGKSNNPSDTLITKIMLGVFGNTPAFDSFFRQGFGIQSFGRKSLTKISDFYQQNKNIIDKYDIFTFDFATGEKTKRKYTKAKLIDMIGFVEGQNA